jgi:hypothetical protein
MGARRIRREQRQVDMFASRLSNGVLKVKERVRRDARMKELIKKGKFPYAPAVQSWLSHQLNKPARLITEEEAKKLVG